jgi:hypothetical protein
LEASHERSVGLLDEGTAKKGVDESGETGQDSGEGEPIP